MFEQWLEQIYNYDAENETRSTLDDILETVDELLRADTGYDILEMVVNDARRLGGDDVPPEEWRSKTPRVISVLLDEIDCARCDLQILCMFVMAVRPLANRINSYDRFVENIKRTHGSEDRFDDVFRGFRGFKQWGEA